MRPGVRLGVDVGSVRVGLAACDREGLVASPVATLARDTSSTDPSSAADVREVVHQARERDAVEVIVGLPLSLSGLEGHAAAAARGYAQALVAAIAPTPVRLVDERLTTVSAHRVMRASGRPGRKQRSVVDQVAAVVVLQHALDSERSSGVLGEQVVPAGGDPTSDDDGASNHGRTVERPWTA